MKCLNGFKTSDARHDSFRSTRKTCKEVRFDKASNNFVKIVQNHCNEKENLTKVGHSKYGCDAYLNKDYVASDFVSRPAMPGMIPLGPPEKPAKK
jgi:hypothetical protein